MNFKKVIPIQLDVLYLKHSFSFCFFGEESCEKNKNKNKNPIVALCLVKLWPQAL
jgi:hypothetical protein